MNKEMLRLAIPNILSNVSIPLLSTVDTILMGNLSPKHLGAVGIASMIFSFIYWNFGFLRMGTTGLTAQAFGANNSKEQIHVFLRAAFIALILAFLMIVGMRLIEWLSILAFNVEGDQADLVVIYFRIRIWAAPASLLIYVMMGWFFGMQNAIYPLIITLSVNIINILLSIYLVKNLGLGIEGVAWGTVAAQYIGLFMAIALFLFKYKDLGKYITDQWRNRQKYLHFLKINQDIFIRTICLTLAIGFFYSKSAEAGELILAINVILFQFINWMSYGVDGFAYAAESMVGKYYGAKDTSKTMETIKLSFIWGFVLAALFSLAYLLFYDELIYIFSKDIQLIQLSQQFRIWMVIFPLAAFACYIWDGIFIGLTASVAMRNMMLIAFVIYIVAYFGLLPILEGKAIWMAMMIFLFARGMLQSLIFAKDKLSLR